MARISQVLKDKRQKKTRRPRSSILFEKPQRKALCFRITTISPKKPNSANRRVAKVNVKASTGFLPLTVKIPGEGHNLQQHSTILLRAGRVRDLIGVSNIAVRGKFDLLGVQNRKTSRSVYGVKKNKT